MIANSLEEILIAGACLGGAALFGRKGRGSRGATTEEPETAAKAQENQVEDAPPEPVTAPITLNQPAGLYAVFETTLGRMVCRLFPEKTPVTVQNFVELAQGAKQWRNEAENKWEQRPYYNGLTFHRVIPKFMIQGGDYRGTGSGGVGYTFEDEFAPDLLFDKPGRLAMANRGPDTNGAQFFITVEPTPWLDNKHSIFGEVAEGQDVANAIANSPRDVRDKPLKPVIVRRVEIVDTRTA